MYTEPRVEFSRAIIGLPQVYSFGNLSTLNRVIWINLAFIKQKPIKNIRKPIEIHANNSMPTKSSQVDDSKTRAAEMVEKLFAQNLSGVLPLSCITLLAMMPTLFQILLMSQHILYVRTYILMNMGMQIYTDRNEYLRLVPQIPSNSVVCPSHWRRNRFPAKRRCRLCKDSWRTLWHGLFQVNLSQQHS